MSDYPPTISPSHESSLLSVSSDYSLSHGLVLRPTSNSTTSSIHAPYSLYPTPFPSHLFHQALSLQTSYNELYAKITTDDQFLERVVGGNVAKVDEFQGKLYEIWKTVKREGINQPLSLGLFRSDYLIHAPKTGGKDGKEVGKEAWGLKQVEFNTISSSFGALSTRVGEMHRYLLESGHYPSHPLLDPSSLPKNPAFESLSQGLVSAHNAYLAQQSQLAQTNESEEESSREKVILMVIQDNERNAFDQRLIEWEVVQKHGIKLLRVPFSLLRTSLTLSPSTHKLLYTPLSPFPTSTSPQPQPLEISLVYYRTAYSPSDYYTHKEWDTRLLIERSKAIKCPSVAMQLSGAKKVQQVLSNPKELTRFVEGEEERKGMMDSWVGLWGMEDGGEGERLARSEAERFVLKPQREGGGNNIYREDIPPFLERLEEEDKGRGEGEPKGKEGFILMELIQPPEGQSQCLVKAGEEEARRADVVSELGVYGVCLLEERGDGKGVEIKVNEMSGWLLRTKGRESDEGGIAVGFSVLDSPLLI